jgi:succinate dehydrogenase/fumarate reductase flavoprotein subunit
MSGPVNHEVHEYDVVVIGAGGAGLRAAIEATSEGARTALVCKSLLGKAHTVMAEGGIAAALRNVWPEDSWQVHFRDTMRGGKMLNNWRMAQLHAQEAPDRVLELERWGALFDRTKDGRILQRDFGGHRYARLAHVGDRTGLEMIRTLQQQAVHLGIDVFMECTVNRLLKDGDRVAGAVAYWRESGKFVVFKAPAVVLGTGGIGKSYAITSNSWEYTGDGHAMALRAGADLIDMEFVQFHPTGMVWPPSVAGILVTEGVRGDGGTLRNSKGERFMFRYIPDFFKAETADNEAEADRWYEDKKNNRRTPDLLPRDEVARAINSEVKAGRGSPHGGVFLDISTRRSPDYIRRRLPSMYHQFKELAGVDITKESMEVGPTCHYVMGGVRVDADTTAAVGVPGLFAVGPPRLRPPRRALRRRARPRRQGERRHRRAPGRCSGAGGDGPRRAEDWREPVRDPEGPPAGHADPGRHHPDGVGAEGRGRRAWPARGACGPRAGRGQPDLQSRLAPRPRPPEPPSGVGRHRAGRSRAEGKPRRAHPGGLPRARSPVRQGQRRRADEGRAARRHPGAAARDAARPPGALRGEEMTRQTRTAMTTSFEVTT